MDRDPLSGVARDAFAEVAAENARNWEWRHALLDEQRATNDLLAKILRTLEAQK